MKNQVTTTTTTCDLCGQLTTDPWNSVSEEHPVGVMSMTYDIWYGGVYDVKDICKGCQAKLADFLHKQKMIAHGQKRVLGAP